MSRRENFTVLDGGGSRTWRYVKRSAGSFTWPETPAKTGRPTA